MEETFSIRWRELRWKDKLLTVEQLAVFAARHGMIWVSLGEFPGWTSSRGSAEDVNRLASFLRLLSQSNSDQRPDLMPPASDRTIAERFGQRVSQLAHRWARP